MNKTSIKVSMLSATAMLTLSIADASPVAINNNSFQSQVLTLRQTLVLTPTGPTGWTGFNVGAGGNWDIGLSYASGADFTAPLTGPASGDNYLWVNRFNGDGTQAAGVYQDVGSLLANTTYTLTIAIGQRAGPGPNGSWSPGIISLLNGTDNTGTLLATGGGLSATPNSWQDFTTSFSTGVTVSGALTIMLSALDAGSIQADFSNVRLDASPVPEPSAFALLGGGFLSFNGTPSPDIKLRLFKRSN